MDLHNKDAPTVHFCQEILYEYYNGGNEEWFGNFKLAITSLFMVRNIRRGYSFS